MAILDSFVKFLPLKGMCMIDKVWLSVEELAERLGVPPSWIYSNHRKERIPSKKFGGHLRFKKTEIERWESSLV
jgi:excisionase family DNA binding protein